MLPSQMQTSAALKNTILTLIKKTESLARMKNQPISGVFLMKLVSLAKTIRTSKIIQLKTHTYIVKGRMINPSWNYRVC